MLAVGWRAGRLWWTWDETMRADDLLSALDALL